MVFNDKLLQQSTVYAFHVPSLNAIKVGFGTDGRTRMIHYSRQYRFSSSTVSLREWKLPSPKLASSIENACHRALLQADFGRVSHVVDEREAKELFDLGHHTYEQAVIVVAEAIEVTISSLYEALGKIKPLSQEKARQQNGEAQRRRESIREEKKKQKEEDDNRIITAAASKIQQRWHLEVEPFVKACDSAETVWKQFNYGYRHQSFLSQLWNGEYSTVYLIRKWDRWPLIKSSIPEIFHAARLAKAFYFEMTEIYGNYAEQAANRIGFSIWSPGGHHLPMVGIYSHEQHNPFLEVRLVVQLATGFGGEGATELMKADSEIMALVKFADQNPFLN